MGERIPKSRFRDRFNVAVLQIGGNDMDGNHCPLLFASKLEDFAKLLQSDYGFPILMFARYLPDRDLGSFR